MNYLFYYIIIFAIFILVIYFIFKHEKPETYKWLLFFFWEGIRIHVWYGGYAIIPLHHYSMVIYSLMNYLLCIHPLTSINIIITFLIGVSGAFSDVLYVTFAFLPAFFYSILNSQRREMFIRPLIFSLGTVIGTILKNRLIPLMGISFVEHSWSLDQISPAYCLNTTWKMLSDFFRVLFVKPPFEGLIIALFIFLYIRIKRDQIKKKAFKVALPDFFILSIIFSFASLLFGCRYEDVSSIRYVLPLVFFPSVYIAFNYVKKNWWPFVFLFLSVFSLGILYYDSLYLKIPVSDLDLYPDIKNTIVLLEENDLTFGAADYWYAKKIMVFDDDLLIMQINSDADQYNVLVNKNWYAGLRSRDAQFVILNNLNEDKIRSNYPLLKKVAQYGEIKILY
jgi:hypothetical protein